MTLRSGAPPPELSLALLRSGSHLSSGLEALHVAGDDSSGKANAGDRLDGILLSCSGLKEASALERCASDAPIFEHSLGWERPPQKAHHAQLQLSPQLLHGVLRSQSLKVLKLTVTSERPQVAHRMMRRHQALKHQSHLSCHWKEPQRRHGPLASSQSKGTR